MHDCMIEWLNDWIILWFYDVINELMNDCIIAWLDDWMNEWLNDWMIEWLNDSMIQWFNDWMIEWLNDEGAKPLSAKKLSFFYFSRFLRGGGKKCLEFVFNYSVQNYNIRRHKKIYIFAHMSVKASIPL